MRKSIKDFLQKNRKINYWQRCIRRSKDPEFIQEVLEIGKNPMRIKIDCLGEKNPGKLIYVAQTMGCDGLFAELRFLISELYYAKKNGMTPVVLIPKESCYYEEHPVNGTTNPFEYYFKPVSDISLEDALESSAVVEHNYYQRSYMREVFGMSSGYIPSEEYMRAAADIVKNYIQLNDIVKPQIDADINSVLNDKKTLAVHVRGADFKRHYKNHPNIVTTEEYIKAVDEIIKQHSFEQIFLATDDSEALDTFRSRFGDKVIYYEDVIRTDGDETVMRSTSNRENHHYKLGYEVIRDVYTLSECDGLIAGMSNVSIFARIVKMSRGSDYLALNYIDKGIK